ncbi:MAG TPA: hypothetical protein PLJ42_08635 [Chitinophagales bacterium]|jgi:hypothetical protein|nr:hypothetical protein [Chitinophagales bacterium]MBP6154038.1 hypothetical protein [Chitinophagales bacterium]HQV78336.1 hypothetical protein [Chitinophagales bacterium]HQW79487.1 hypothetical protein [Chitinophagales bacterium]HRB18738.1 hypothetical protein [Chitinophagales bacterium]
MNNNLTFKKTVNNTLSSKIDVNLWQHVQNSFKEKLYKKTIQDCINYINPEIEKKYANSDKSIYTIPHGSIIVSIQITDSEFKVDAPFLDIEKAKIVPILRQVAQLNFYPLSISNIELEGTLLHFKFSCALELCEPYKVYEILREICINADNYDDEFISKFNAKHIQEPKVIPFPDTQKEEAWYTLQLYIQEALEIFHYLEEKRLNAYLWDILIITLLKIDYYCAPQGTLRIEIEKTISTLNSKDEYLQRLNNAKSFLQSLQTMDKTSFESSLYHIDIFVPYKFRTDLDGVRDLLKYAYETSEKEIKAGDYRGAVFTLNYGILNLFYHHYVENKISDLLSNAMFLASKLLLKEAAEILFNAIEQIMISTEFTTTTKRKPVEKKGIFNKLFK